VSWREVQVTQQGALVPRSPPLSRPALSAPSPLRDEEETCGISVTHLGRANAILFHSIRIFLYSGPVSMTATGGQDLMSSSPKSKLPPLLLSALPTPRLQGPELFLQSLNLNNDRQEGQS
jgi:hypothetical protein